MRVETDGEGVIVLKEVYNSVILETAEGKKLAICMRDDTFEMTLAGSDKWFRVDPNTGEINKL